MEKRKEEIIKKYLKRYGSERNKKDLKKRENKHRDLIDKWIINKPKNSYYPYKNPYIYKGDSEYYALLDWIIPRDSYVYQKIDMDKVEDFQEYCSRNNNGYKVSRSSFIPVVRDGKEIYWLLGSFHDYDETKYPILADFGGKCEAIDKNIKRKNSYIQLNSDVLYNFNCEPLNCAFREMHEETRGILDKTISNKLKNKNNFYGIVGTNDIKKEKIFFLFILFDYDEVENIPNEFKTTQPSKDSELLGGLGFYKEIDLLNQKYRTSRNLTDLIIKLKKVLSLK